jgi:hypothetical protein
MDEIFFEIFESLPRQGPGDRASTEKAFRPLEGLPERPDILDLVRRSRESHGGPERLA